MSRRIKRAIVWGIALAILAFVFYWNDPQVGPAFRAWVYALPGAMPAWQVE